MEPFLRAGAGILMAVILIPVLGSHGKQTALLLSVAVCCMAASIGADYLRPVISCIRNLQETAGMEQHTMNILLKVVGICLISELAALICTDAGSSAMGKSMQLLAACTVLWLSVPILESLLHLVQTILGDL